MSDPFQKAADAPFARFGIAATYFPRGGAPVENIRVLPSHPDGGWSGLNGTDFRADTTTVRIRVADLDACRNPGAGDHVEFAGKRYRIDGPPVTDARRLMHVFATRPA